MSEIVCALRGGPDSRATMRRAITLAQETSLPLRFLYVVNRELAPDRTAGSAKAVRERLRQVGGSMVLVAQAIANSHDISAQSTVRYGYVEDEIAGLCQDIDARYLVVSQPHGSSETNAFTPDRLERFRARVEREAGVKVILTEGDGP